MERLSNPRLIFRQPQKIEYKKHDSKEVKSKNQNINNQQVINNNKTLTSQESTSTDESFKAKSSMIPFKLPSFSDFLKKAKSRSFSGSQTTKEEQNAQKSLQPIDIDLYLYMEALRNWYLEISKNVIDFWEFFRIFFLDNQMRFAHLKEIYPNSIPQRKPYTSQVTQGKDILEWKWYYPEKINEHLMLNDYMNVWQPLYWYYDDTNNRKGVFYLLDKNVSRKCDLNNNLSTGLINKNTLCRNLVELNKFGWCKIDDSFGSLFRCLRDYFQNKSLPSDCSLRKLKSYVDKVYKKGQKYFAYMKQVFARQMIPQVVEMCYIKCLCEDLGIRCSDKSGIALNSEDVISHILYDTIYKKEFLSILTFAHLFRHIIKNPPWHFKEQVCKEGNMKDFLTQSIGTLLNDLKDLFFCDGTYCMDIRRMDEWESEDLVKKAYAKSEEALRGNMDMYKRKIKNFNKDYEKLNKIVIDYLSGLEKMKDDQKYCFGLYLSFLSQEVNTYAFNWGNTMLKTYYNKILTNIKNKLSIWAPSVYSFVKDSIILLFIPSLNNILWSRLEGIFSARGMIEELVKGYFYKFWSNNRFGLFVYIDFAIAYLERSYKTKRCANVIPDSVDKYIKDFLISKNSSNYEPFWQCIKNSPYIFDASSDRMECLEKLEGKGDINDQTIKILKDFIKDIYDGKSLLLNNLDDFFNTLHQKTKGKVWKEFVDSKWEQCCVKCCDNRVCDPNRPECPKDEKNDCSDKWSYNNYCTEKAPSENFREKYLKEAKDILGEEIFKELRDRISKFKDVLPFSEEALKCPT